MTTSLSEKQVEEFKEVFDFFDANKNESLSRDELVSALTSLGMPPSSEDLDAIFIKTDSNLSNTIEFPEFCQWISSKVNISSHDELIEIFKLIDLDGNGVISRDELHDLLVALKIDHTSEELTTLISSADMDKNGVIDYYEFLNSSDLWTHIKLTVGVSRSFKEILRQYTQLATNPSAGFGTTMPLPYGKENAQKMGYDVDKLPDDIWESSCMCGNSFSHGEVSEGETVIDLGCGAGADLCVAASKVGASGTVYGIDMTTAMINKAKENAEKCGFENIEVIKAPFDTGKHQDIPVGVADVVIANGTFNLSPRKKCAFVQAFNCLKPGGRFHFVDMIREGSSCAESEEGSWCDCVAGAFPINKLTELMKEVGFEDCKHLEFTDYRTSDYTVAATVIARKPL